MSSHTESLDSIIERRKKLSLRCKSKETISKNESLVPKKISRIDILRNGLISPSKTPGKFRRITNHKSSNISLIKPWRRNRFLFNRVTDLRKRLKSRNLCITRRFNENHLYRSNHFKKLTSSTSPFSNHLSYSMCNSELPCSVNDSSLSENKHPSPLIQNMSVPVNDLDTVQMMESSSGIFNYCLDRELQVLIHRIQSDFKLTERYKNFMLSEMPFIEDFKPSPVGSGSKLNDRFKCLFKQLLDFENLSFMDEMGDH